VASRFADNSRTHLFVWVGAAILTVTLTLGAFTAASGTAWAAGPRMMIFYGTGVSQPIYVTDRDDSMAIYSASYDGEQVPLDVLEERIFLRVALLWGEAVDEYLARGGKLTDIRPQSALYQGRFYPATDEQPAVVSLPGDQPRVASADILRILRGYGVPVRVTAGDSDFPWWLLGGASAIGLALIVTFAGAARCALGRSDALLRRTPFR
jgi:hypothetical protein